MADGIAAAMITTKSQPGIGDELNHKKSAAKTVSPKIAGAACRHFMAATPP
jgi:hypothetical protein